MRSKNMSVLVVVLLLLSLSSVCLVAADVSISAYYDYSNESYWVKLRAEDPSATSYASATSNSFDPTVSGNLTRISVRGRNYGTPYASLKCRVEGNFNALNSIPNGTVLATSTNTVSVSTSFNNLTDSEIHFDFNGSLYIREDMYYTFIIYVDSSTVLDTDTNYVQIRIDHLSPNYGGYISNYLNTGWGAPSTTQELVFYVFVDDSIEITPAPSATSTTSSSGSGGSYNFLDDDLVLFMLALLFIFVPPMLVVISVPKVGMAGFMVVLTGCAALGVFYLDLPFYFLVFVAIGIGVMFYSILRRV